MNTTPAPAATATVARATNLPDLLTISAIAVIAYAISDFIHEGLGHGGACILSGGHPLLLSSVAFQCDGEGRLIAAAGTFANFIFGFLAWFAMRFVSRATRLRYLLWVLMVVNLLQAAGYFLFSGISNIGDWAVVIEGLQPSWVWRTALTILGIVLYYLFVVLVLREMRPFLGADRTERLRRARRLTWGAYISGSLLITVSGLLNPVGMILVAISAAASSFGGTSGFAWMGMLLHGPHFPPSRLQMPPLARSRAWIVAGALVAIAFILILGPGVGMKFR